MNSADISKEPIILYPTGNSQKTFAPIVYRPEAKTRPTPPPKPKKPKIQYPQKWKEYDEAKTNEAVLFKRILDELLWLAEEPPNPAKKGRKGFSKRDKLFCMAIKTYYKSDLRKAQSILKEIKNLGLIRKVPCFKSIDNFFNNKNLVEELNQLLLLSALPLANLETTGAIDSTGFSTSQFECWNTYKWGKHEGKERIWRKAHAFTGTQTNIFLSIEVTEKNVGDARMVEDVVAGKAKYFDLQDFVADKAYSSRKIPDFIHKQGMTPFIPFKKNTTGKPQGYRIWRQMFEHFRYNERDFLEHYHQRSNIETSFHMLKQRFGKHLMTRNFTAHQTEILCKALCHNICCLIAEIFESEISIDWQHLCKIKQECVKTPESVQINA